jgi:hypothetical protein
LRHLNRSTSIRSSPRVRSDTAGPRKVSTHLLGRQRLSAQGRRGRGS